MKIVVGCSSEIDQGSGILSYCKSLAVFLEKNGHDVYFIYPKTEDKSWLMRNNITGISINVMNEPKVEVQKLFSALEEITPDFIINNDNCFLQQLAPAITCPFYFVLHLGNYSILELAKINMKYVDRYIATTTDMKFDLTKIGIPTDKISVILNGLNEGFSFSKQRGSKIRVLFAGEPTKRKGADKFIKLLNNHSLNNVQFHWTVGDKVDLIRDKINSNNDVVLHPRLPTKEFHTLLKDSDVFLMPSRDEGLPISLLEAIGYGLLPIVSNGKGAMKEVVEHGVNGFICNLKDWDVEAASILKRITTKNIEYFSSETLSTFSASYSSGEYANKLVKLFDNLEPINKNKDLNIQVYQWHRPGSVGIGFIASVINRTKIKLGIISKLGRLTLQQVKL
jgi:glycosyltransferase involved in cell wall biosynthesis